MALSLRRLQVSKVVSDSSIVMIGPITPGRDPWSLMINDKSNKTKTDSDKMYNRALDTILKDNKDFKFDVTRKEKNANGWVITATKQHKKVPGKLIYSTYAWTRTEGKMYECIVSVYVNEKLGKGPY